MAQARIDYQTNTGNVQTKTAPIGKNAENVNENGEAIYYAPIRIYNKADLDNYHITWDDCKTMPFGGSEKVKVYYYPTTDKRLADFLRAELNTEHSKGYRSMRCNVLGKSGKLIRCSDENKCTACPYGRKPEDRDANIISLDLEAEKGHEFESGDRRMAAKLAEMEFQKIKERMDAKNPIIAEIIFKKEFEGFEVSEIAEEYNLTSSQVYYYLKQAREIGIAYQASVDQL